MLDTSGGAWCTPAANTLSGEDLTRRCRHAVASVGPFIFIYGGLKGSQLLDDLLLADDSGGTELTICDPRSPAWSQYFNTVHGSANAAQMLAKAAAEEAAAAQQALSKSGSGSMGDLQCLDENIDGHAERDMRSGISESPASTRDESPTITLNHHKPGSTPPTPDVRLYHRAVVAPMEPPLRYQHTNTAATASYCCQLICVCVTCCLTAGRVRLQCYSAASQVIASIAFTF